MKDRLLEINLVKDTAVLQQTLNFANDNERQKALANLLLTYCTLELHTICSKDADTVLDEFTNRGSLEQSVYLDFTTRVGMLLKGTSKKTRQFINDMYEVAKANEAGEHTGIFGAYLQANLSAKHKESLIVRVLLKITLDQSAAALVLKNVKQGDA